MTTEQRLDRLKLLIGDAAAGAKDEQLSLLLENAEGYILSYCNRGQMNAALETALIQLAVIYFNRMGMEGEASHGEGGVSRSAEMLPADIKATLNSQRLLKGAMRSANAGTG